MRTTTNLWTAILFIAFSFFFVATQSSNKSIPVPYLELNLFIDTLGKAILLTNHDTSSLEDITISLFTESSKGNFYAISGFELAAGATDTIPFKEFMNQRKQIYPDSSRLRTLYGAGSTNGLQTGFRKDW